MTEMKVVGPTGIEPTRRAEQTARPDKRESREGDRVSTRQQAHLKEVQRAAQKTGGEEHSARLRELETQIKAGSYRPDPARIAEEILRSAELQAQISAMLN